MSKSFKIVLAKRESITSVKMLIKDCLTEDEAVKLADSLNTHKSGHTVQIMGVVY